MACQTVIIQADQPNVVSVNVGSVPVVEALCPTPQVVEVCSKVQINNYTYEVGGGGGGVPPSGDCCDLEDPIDVSNQDTAIGNALGAFYPVGTTLETILRDILEPDIAPKIKNVKVGIKLGSSAVSYTSSSQTLEWGTQASVEGWKFTLEDQSQVFDEASPLILTSTIYGSGISFPISTFGVSNWDDLSLETLLDTTDTDLNYTGLSAYKKTYTSSIKLWYLKSAGGGQYAETSAPSITFGKRNWLLSSPIHLDGIDTIADFNQLLASSVVMDEGITTSSNLSMTTNSSVNNQNNYVYIVIPSNLSIDTSLGTSITTGAFNVGNAFIDVGTYDFRTGYFSNGSEVTYQVTIYQSDQPKPYSPGQTLSITTN